MSVIPLIVSLCSLVLSCVAVVIACSARRCANRAYRIAMRCDNRAHTIAARAAKQREASVQSEPDKHSPVIWMNPSAAYATYQRNLKRLNTPSRPVQSVEINEKTHEVFIDEIKVAWPLLSIEVNTTADDVNRVKLEFPAKTVAAYYGDGHLKDKESEL